MKLLRQIDLPRHSDLLRHTHLLARILLLALALPACAAVPLPAPDDDPAYTAGTRAMNESRWQDAVTSFDQVVSARSKRADAALYWKAYALNKLNKQQLAAATCAVLRKDFRESPWNRDCGALKLVLVRVPAGQAQDYAATAREYATARHAYAYSTGDPYNFDFDFDTPGTNGNNPHTGDPDADLKILALNSLVNRDPAQAMPILRNILTGNQSATMKQHAIFVLTQSRSPEAAALMKELILGRQGPGLQRQAIQASGVYYGRRNNDALAEVYRTTTDPQVKRSILSAFFISGDDAHMVEMARAEKDMTLKRAIVSQLSLMKGKAAEDYMMELLK